MVEQKLPLRALDLECGLFSDATWLLQRALAIVDEVERVPAGGYSKSGLCMTRRNVRCGLGEIGKNRVRAKLPEPVGRVASVGLLSMQDGVPEAAFGRGELLRGLVS